MRGGGGGGVLGWAELVLDEAVTEDYLTVSVSVFTEPYLAGGGGGVGGARVGNCPLEI